LQALGKLGIAVPHGQGVVCIYTRHAIYAFEGESFAFDFDFALPADLGFAVLFGASKEHIRVTFGMIFSNLVNPNL
jgi:hypothetical protein